MAIGIDLAIIALEIAMLTAVIQAERREIGRFAKPIDRRHTAGLRPP